MLPTKLAGDCHQSLHSMELTKSFRFPLISFPCFQNQANILSIPLVVWFVSLGSYPILQVIEAKKIFLLALRFTDYIYLSLLLEQMFSD